MTYLYTYFYKDDYSLLLTSSNKTTCYEAPRYTVILLHAVYLYFCFLAYYKMHSEHILVSRQCNNVFITFCSLSCYTALYWKGLYRRSTVKFLSIFFNKHIERSICLQGNFFVTFIPLKSSFKFPSCWISRFSYFQPSWRLLPKLCDLRGIDKEQKQ